MLAAIMMRRASFPKKVSVIGVTNTPSQKKEFVVCCKLENNSIMAFNIHMNDKVME